MNGTKNVILLSHKPAHSPPSDHEVEDATLDMFSSITNMIPNNTRVFEVAAHNHLMAESSNGQWFISGAGGRKLDDFSPHSAWAFINNQDFGYLQIKINNTDGKVLSTDFHGLDGKVIR